MKITQIRFHGEPKGNFLSYVDVIFDDEVCVNGLKIICSNNKFLIAMPSVKKSKDVYLETVHPVSRTARKKIEKIIIQEYLLYVNTI